VEAQLKQVLDRLNAIDRKSFEEKESQLSALNAELQNWETEWRQLLQSQKRGEIDRLEKELAALKEREATAARAFERVQQEIGDISPHAARLNEWRLEVTTAFPALDAAAREFERLEAKAEAPSIQYWERLLAARKELTLVFRQLRAHRQFQAPRRTCRRR
jgi:DNA repair exonuclease SbcCD ATPase subunit